MSGKLFFERIRRLGIGQVGVVGAAGLPPAVEGRPDDYRLAPARLLEDQIVLHRSIGAAESCPEPIAFLDGTQGYEVVGYVDTAPVVAAIIRAAVRLRIAGTLKTVVRTERRILVGRQEALDRFDAGRSGLEVEVLDAEARVHPLKELEQARLAIDRARTQLERTMGIQFRARSDAWLVVDGVASDTPAWTTDPKVIGVSKSHATLPFDGDDLSRYLTLPQGHRTSIFEPATWRFAPVHSWALRLWPFEGKDLLHGLVRIEVAARQHDEAAVDRISRWIMAERVPLSRPDPRWDRLLYGVATVERHLRAR